MKNKIFITKMSHRYKAIQSSESTSTKKKKAIQHTSPSTSHQHNKSTSLKSWSKKHDNNKTSMFNKYVN